MQMRSWFGAVVAILVLLLTRCAGTQTPQNAMISVSAKPQITILYDAFGKSSELKKDWGFSAFIEYGGKRILVDTGNNADIFAHNVKAKGIDLTRLDFAVITHRHGDHTTGLNYLTSINQKVKLYAPKENFGVFGAELPGTFLKPNDSLPPEMRYFDGKVPEKMRFGTPWPQGNFEWVTKTTEIAPGFHLILLKGSWGVDLDVMEISLAIDTPDGIVLVVGCGHPTIEKIVEAAKATISKPIHLVVGGTHLLPAKDDEIIRIATALREEWRVEFIAPAHCTGEAGFAAFKQIFGDRYVYAGLGTTIALGPTIKTLAAARQPRLQAVDDEDMRSYRTLLAQSDDSQEQLPTQSGSKPHRLAVERTP
jgi:7,8-dihydropterin-6-yl-methyl-4-(beta-D-ribofuranosyl)aminobenzene 5'-phosphate synthase